MSVISKKIRNSARGQECQVRIHDVCNGNSETVILAHVGRGSGMGQKCDDIHATYACSSCHDAIDGRTRVFEPRLVRLYAYEGMIRTQKLLLEQGLIEVAK
ncbi:YbcO [Pseudoalteromonas phage vB_Pun_Y3]